MQTLKKIQLLISILLTFVSACSNAAAGGTTVWIDVPTDGLAFPSLQPIKIEGHASSPGGVAKVEVWINGVLANTTTDLTVEGTLASFHMEWTPVSPSVYTIQAIAFGMDGAASQPDTTRVTFGDVTPTLPSGCPSPVGGGPTPVSCGSGIIGCPSPVGGGPTPVSCGPEIVGCPSPVGGGPTPVSCGPEIVGCPSPVGGGPTPVSCTSEVEEAPVPVSSLIQFWADPPEIEAGACTTIYWHVENVQRVIFGGIDQPFDGSYEDCLCANQRYTLTVVNQDGTEEKHRVDIAVNGECVTPEPVDSEPPPAPTPAVPADGLSIACEASQSLVWLPVDDPSGIATYQVQVQRHAGDSNWQAAPGGDKNVDDKTTSVRVECGWYYRWHVRAVDGVGNISEWSGWSTFAITLS